MIKRGHHQNCKRFGSEMRDKTKHFHGMKHVTKIHLHDFQRFGSEIRDKTILGFQSHTESISNCQNLSGCLSNHPMWLGSSGRIKVTVVKTLRKPTRNSAYQRIQRSNVGKLHPLIPSKIKIAW